MSKFKTNKPLLFIGLYIMIFYSFLGLNQADSKILIAGTDIIQILPPALASFWLIRSYAVEKNGKMWLMFGIGIVSYLTGILIWGFTEIVLGQTVFFPGLSDLFWMLTYLFFFMAILQKVFDSKSTFYTVQFLFDLFLVMMTAIMFSYKFIIGPMLELFNGESFLFKVVYLSYPIGDLAILLGVVTLYLSSNHFLDKKAFNLLIAGLFIYFAADTAYVYLVVKEIYSTGNYLDPLFSLSLMLIGAASLYSGPGQVIKTPRADEKINLKFLIPYLSLFLFIFLMVIFQEDPIVIYSGILVMCVIILRFIFVILENKMLLKQLETSNAELEKRIEVRTRDLEESKQKYQSLFEHHPDYVFSLDLNGNIMTINKAFKEKTGSNESQIIGYSFLPLLREEDRKPAFQKYLQAKEGIPQDFEVMAADGQILQITNIPMVLNEEVIGVFGIGRNITQQKLAIEQIDFLANHDSLTGLPNMRMFEKRINEAVKSYKGNPFYVLLLDLDGFKEVNDGYGHDVGDLFLQLVGKRLRASVRECDIVARLGGDEFIILLADIEPSDVESTAGRILTTLTESFEINGQVLNVSCSIGVSAYPKDGLEITKLMKYADIAMYRVKQNGKNDVSFYAKSG